MIEPNVFCEAIHKVGIKFVTGVPDSLLKEFCRYVDKTYSNKNHVVTTSEGAAVSLASGFYLATGGISLVYLQNSGLGNAINPLLSLVDKEVYGFPMILLIGWRGNPNLENFKDEPQHIKQGRVTPTVLNAIEIPFKVLSTDESIVEEQVSWAVSKAREIEGPVVILVNKDTSSKNNLSQSTYTYDKESTYTYDKVRLSREETIKLIIKNIPSDSFIVSSTGMISRELYETREYYNQCHSKDFLTVGSMGFASQIALGICLAKPNKKVVCLDGDGAALMHLGGMASIGASNSIKYRHILLNNGVHDSVGGQPTLGFKISFTKIAYACGYKKVIGPILTAEEIKKGLEVMFCSDGPSFMEIQIKPGARQNLGRPRETPAQNKRLFQELLRQ